MEVVCYGYDKYLFHTAFCFGKKNKNEKSTYNNKVCNRINVLSDNLMKKDVYKSKKL